MSVREESYFFGLINLGGSTVRWTVHVPSSVAVTSYSGNSGVKVASVRGPLTVRTSNGGVLLHVPAGFHMRVTTQTWNGAVQNPFAGASGPGNVSIATSNGGIEVATSP